MSRPSWAALVAAEPNSPRTPSSPEDMRYSGDMRRVVGIITVLTILALAPAPASAIDCCERITAGFIYVKASGAALRDAPDESGAVVAKPPVGARLVYRKQMETTAGPQWYFVEPPGQKAGWIAISETSPTRPTAPPPGRPMNLVDSGLGAPRPTAAQTAAARGLSDKAKNYASEKQELKLSVDQFLTLEKAVEDLYGDPHNPKDGSYEDKDPKGMRKSRAAKFQAELK